VVALKACHKLRVNRPPAQAHSVAEHAAELDDAVLGPVAVFAVGAVGEEADVAAAAREDEQHVGVGGDAGVAERLDRDERVVLGVDDERRDSDRGDDRARPVQRLVIAEGDRRRTEIRRSRQHQAGRISGARLSLGKSAS